MMPPRPAGKAGCPVCGRPPSPEARPFCTPRCRDVDLGRWLAGAYAIPAADDGEADAAPANDNGGAP